MLFIKSPNHKGNVGTERDKYIPNPQTSTEKNLESYFKLGFLMAVSHRCAEVLNFDFPSILWKYLLFKELEWEDIKCIDVNIYVCLEKIEKMPEDEIEYLDENFVTFQFDGNLIELKPNGNSITLTAENRYEYISLVKEKYFAQILPAFKSIRDGYYFYASQQTNGCFQTVKSFEQSLSGFNTVDLDVLKKITQYNGDKFEITHPTVQRFWRVLEGFNQEQLANYLQYVWGRKRLSAGQNDIHKLTYCKEKSGCIPEAHTCFFELDIGDYATDEDLRSKLLYGIEQCGEIADDDQYEFDADFGI